MARMIRYHRMACVFAGPLPALALFAISTAADAQPALPTGGTVVAGSASLGAPAGSSLTVTQSSARAIVDWTGFSIGQGGSVRFDNGSGATLNRVTGASVSSIDGLLGASGSVYLINPNGVVIGNTGVVDVGGSFVGATLKIGNAAFMAGGDLAFTGSGDAAVINLGKVGALGGDVALIASRVENRGTITAANGTAGLLAGTDVLLRDAALDGGRFVVRVGGAGTSATNAGTIAAAAAELRANGGNVYALAGDTGGAISATGVATRDGRIWLTAGDAGTTQVAGTLSARGANGAPGQIETSAGSVQVGAATIDAGVGGTWLLDPTDLTIDQIAANTIAGTLNAGTNVTQQTSAAGTGGNGDINVSPNVALTWATGAGLTLSAYRNIALGAGATLTSTGGGAVTLYADNTGTGTGAVTFGTGAKVSTAGAVNILYDPTAGSGKYFFSNMFDYSAFVAGGATLTAYMLVNSVADLEAVTSNLYGTYALGRDIDDAGQDFAPIGTSFRADPYSSMSAPRTPFMGIFDGRGHAISNISITVQNSGFNTYVGLFGATGQGAVIRNLNLVGGTVSGAPLTVAGASGYPIVGALVGGNYGGTISNVSSTVTVSGIGSYIVGGLVGVNSGGTITNSYVAAPVTGTSYFFTYYYGRSNNIPATGGSGNIDVGGLVGSNSGTILASYATGAVTGDPNSVGIGGFVGENAGTIDSAYASGAVKGGPSVGGFVGSNSGMISNVYWDETTTGQLLAFATNSGTVTRLVGIGGDTGYSPYAQATYTHFSFGTGGTWVMLDGQTRPFLASEYSTNITNAHQLQLVATNPGASYTVGASFSAAETDGASNPSGMWTAAGFLPIGTTAAPLTGPFDGAGKTITGLFINRPTTDDVGLFGSATGAVRNVTLAGARIAGQFYVGALAGSVGGSVTGAAVTGGTITGISVGGVVGTAAGSLRDIVASANVVTARDGAGGVVGNSTGAITNAVVTGGSVTGGDGVGGVAGGTTASIGDSTSSAAVTGHTYVGGLVGYIGHTGAGAISSSDAGSTASSAISGSSASGAVTGSSDVGGLIGYSEASVESSFASGSVTSGNNASGVGGLIGFANIFKNARIADVYATGAVTTGQSSRSVGGLIGVVSRGPTGRAGGFISNAYATGAVTAGPLSIDLGGFIGSADSGVPISGGFWDVGSTGQAIGVGSGLAAGSSVTGIGGTTGISPYVQATYASFNAATWVIFEGSTRPILRSEYSRTITNAHQLQLVALNPGVDYTLVNDLDLSVIAKPSEMWNPAVGFVPIASGAAPFTGTLDGGGHGIANLSIVRAGTDNVGLFAGIGNTGVIKNLTLAGAAITGRGNVGVVAGFSTGRITGVTIGGSVTGGDSVGGLVGYNLGSVSGSALDGTAVTATNFAGGLVGYNTGMLAGTITGIVTASGSYAGGLAGYNDRQATLSGTFTGIVGAHDYAGGVAGFSGGTIATASSVGTVNAARGAGGLVGFNTGTITGSTAAAAVTAADLAGGFVGVNFGMIAGQSTNSTVSGGTQLGGFAGANASGGTLTNVSASGAVTGTGTLGGLVGYNDGGIVTSFAGGAVGGAGANFAGGLVGYNALSITGSYATGAVAGGSFVGGLVGYSDRLGTIANSAAYSRVSGVQYAGGLAGFNAGAIANSQTNSAVSASDRGAGGLVAYNIGTITRAFANGSVSAPALSGGLVGLNFGSVALSYANASASGTDSVGGLVGANAGTLAKVYATGTVSGSTQVGGLLGYSRGSVGDVYATGAVTGNDAATTGGLVGFADTQSAIARGYAAGAVAPGGGVAGTNNGTLSAIFYDAGTTGAVRAVAAGSAAGTAAVGGATGRSAYAQASYPGLNFLDIWTIQQGQSRATLQDNPQNPAPK